MELTLRDNKFIIDNIGEIRTLLIESFSGVLFNGSYTKEKVLEEVLHDVKTRPKVQHIVATTEGKIVGILFSVAMDREPATEKCTVGWFFSTPQSPRRQRIAIAKMIFDLFHDLMKKLGYVSVETEMGTVEGEHLMKKLYGYIHHPLKDKANNWLKVL